MHNITTRLQEYNIYKNYKLLFLLITLIINAGCNNCDCIDNNTPGVSYNNIYFTAKTLNDNLWYSFLYEDNNYTKIASNSELFSTTSNNEKIAVLVHEKNTKSLVLRDLFGDTIGKEIAKSNIKNFGYPVLSSTGNQVLYNIDRDLYLWNYNSKTDAAYLELLTSSFASNNTLPSFSYDGKYIAFIEADNNNKSLLKVAASSATDNIIFSKDIEVPQTRVTEIQWMPNRNAFYFIMNDTAVYYYDLVEGEELISFGNTTNLGVVYLDISSNKRYAVFVNLKNELWIKDIASNGFYKILSNEENSILRNPKLNYDSSKLILLYDDAANTVELKNKTGNLYLLDLYFQNNIPKVINSTLIFNNVSTAYWGRYTKL